VEGSLVAFTKGSVATIGRVNDRLYLSLEAGEAMVESDGVSWIIGKSEVTVRGRAIVAPAKVVLLSDLTEKEAARRFAPYSALRPRQRTWVLLDFAGEKGGVLAASPEGKLILARLLNDAPAPFGKKLFVKFRYRSTAANLHVNLFFENLLEPVTATVSATKKDWQEAMLPISRFQASAKEPAAGTRIIQMDFFIDTEEGGKGQATLEIDDVVLLERD
jgi:hypothetical protein